MKTILYAATSFVLLFTLAGCGSSGSNGSSSDAPVIAPTPSPSPSASPTTAALDVSPCLNQKVAGRSVASLVVPDVVTFDPTQASGFPNGRQLQDPVIDLELAALLLDVTKNPVSTFANIPLDPSGNDKPLPGVFPFLADAWGGAPAAVGGSGFVFRTDSPSSYTRVDRMGEPAVSTALVDTADKSAYNDDNPTVDATGKWVPVFKADLTALAQALDGQLTSLGLKVCAVPAAAKSSS